MGWLYWMVMGAITTVSAYSLRLGWKQQLDLDNYEESWKSIMDLERANNE